MAKRKYFSWKFLCIGGVILLLALIGAKILWSQYQEKKVILTVQQLENNLQILEKDEVSYFRSDNKCKKFIISDKWVAEPRNNDCGSENKYMPFSSAEM